MEPKLIAKFWAEMVVPTQDRNPEVNFANPADVSISLVQARNWSATIGQELADKHGAWYTAKRELRKTTNELSLLEAEVLAAVDKVPTYAVKNFLNQRAFVLKNCDTAQREQLLKLLANAEHHEETVDRIEASIRQLEIMRKSLEKSTDWLVQYINWHKFELRELSQ